MTGSLKNRTKINSKTVIMITIETLFTCENRLDDKEGLIGIGKSIIIYRLV